MTRRAKVVAAVAALFALLNVGGAAFAGAQGEVSHAAAHVALFLLSACVVWWYAPRRDARTLPHDVGERLTQLEHSLDSVAVEIERIGEGQRFMTRLFTEHGTPRAAGKEAAEPVEVGAPKPPPNARRG